MQDLEKSLINVDQFENYSETVIFGCSIPTILECLIICVDYIIKVVKQYFICEGRFESLKAITGVYETCSLNNSYTTSITLTFLFKI